MHAIFFLFFFYWLRILIMHKNYRTQWKLSSFHLFLLFLGWCNTKKRPGEASLSEAHLGDEIFKVDPGQNCPIVTHLCRNLKSPINGANQRLIGALAGCTTFSAGPRPAPHGQSAKRKPDTGLYQAEVTLLKARWQIEAQGMMIRWGQGKLVWEKQTSH